MQITNASGQLVADAVGDLGDHAGILADQVVARHAGGAREAGGDDHHVGALDGGIIRTACHHRVETLDRAGLHDVERLARRHAAEHVEQDDVAQFLQSDQMGERAADIAGADEGDLAAGHALCPCRWRRLGAVGNTRRPSGVARKRRDRPEGEVS